MIVSRGERGTALAETALVVGMTLTIVFNALQIAMLGFSQLHADAVAYAAARIEAVTGSDTTARNAVATALPPAIGSLATTNGNGVSEATATATTDGLMMLGGSDTITVHGAYEEPIAPTGGTNSAFAFAVPMSLTSLPNYFPPGTIGASAASSHPVYLAQSVSGGNGSSNGPFHEWRDHDTCFASVGFPSSYSQTQDGVSGGVYVIGASNPWVTLRSGSAEAKIYGWDAAGYTSATC